MRKKQKPTHSGSRAHPSIARGPNAKFVFFGTEPLAVCVLTELEKAGYTPSLIVAAPDKVGRGGRITPPLEKAWGAARNIPVLQPDALDTACISKLKKGNYELFIVASYGKILPKALLDIPKRGVLNVHPSLLPRLRGASPIRTAILNDDRNLGVTIMLMDEKMDHGPIIAQRKVAPPSEWPPRGRDLDLLLANEGGRLLAEFIGPWRAGHIVPKEQNHDLATYTEKIEKGNGCIDLADDPRTNLLKIRAYDGWPGAYTFLERNGKKVRVRIADAHIDSRGTLTIDRVIPEGKKEMSFGDFERGVQ